MKARLTAQLVDASGAVVDERVALNSVMRAGAELVAGLFTGSLAKGITHMAVGSADTPETDRFATDALTSEGLTGALDAEIPPASFTVSVDADRRLAIVKVRGTMPNAAALGSVREAGLVSRADDGTSVLYNRVTFAPITKGDDHELTLFWEITFPYGDLPWMG
jgi:hypothetical protein